MDDDMKVSRDNIEAIWGVENERGTKRTEKILNDFSNSACHELTKSIKGNIGKRVREQRGVKATIGLEQMERMVALLKDSGSTSVQIELSEGELPIFWFAKKAEVNGLCLIATRKEDEEINKNKEKKLVELEL